MVTPSVRSLTPPLGAAAGSCAASAGVRGSRDPWWVPARGNLVRGVTMRDGQATDGGATGSDSAGAQTIHRDDVVDLFVTPDHTTGSVNEPRLQLEHGIEFNEKWTYDRPLHEPARP